MLMGQSDSMRDAGADKHNKRFLVYAGGSLVAFVLDVQIREATNNKKSLDTMMAAMYDEFGTPDSRYVYEDIVRVASEVSGKDLSGFFDRYVSGSDFLDATPFIETAGLRLDQSIDEFYITLADAPSKQQAAIRKGMLGW
jgi:predicted metalloprotease with PDZ domain